MVEDRRAVLAAEIKALAVTGGRIVDLPERLQQLRKTGLVRVEPHLDRLGVAGAVPANPLIGRVRDMPAGVADGSPQHSVNLAEGRLDTPEAPGREGRALGSVRAVALEWRCQHRVGGLMVLELKQRHTPSTVNARPALGIPARRCGLLSQTGTSAWIAMALAARSRTFPRKRFVKIFTNRFRGA